MRFLSICSGIEAASVAWQPLGWKAWAFSEIDPFASAVLAHHYPTTPNLGDMTKFKDWPDAAVDLLCGGTPCQSFSNAGLRAGLDDPRGQLMLTFGAIAARYRPRWLVWENVPGVLSSNGGRDFGAFLGLLGHLGYGFAYRVLDAQYVRVDGYGRAVPQRRQRVFVVGCLGDWRSAAAVLLERESLRGDPAPRREAGARVAACLTRGAESSGKGGYAGRRQEDDVNIVAYGGNNTSGPRDVASALTAHGGAGRMDFESETFVAHTLRGEGFDASEDGTGRGIPLTVHAFDARQTDVIQYGDKAGPLDTDGFSQAVLQGGESSHADAQEAGPIEALRALRNADEPQAFREWCLGVVAQFWPQEVLRSEVHGRRFRRSAQPQRGLVNVALSRSQTGSAWSVQDVWEAGCDGRAPQGWQPHEQRARELGAYLSELPHSPSPAERLLRCLRRVDEGSGVLREALAALQEARRSALGEGQPAQPGARVRRLIVEECEALMGFPRGYTAVPYRGKPAADGPRYKALGNSWAVNCARWVGWRISVVDGLLTRRAA